MNEQKILSMIGFARRAGAVCKGHDAVVKSVVNGKSKCILFCSDVSEKRVKEITILCKNHQISVPFHFLSFDMNTLYAATGMRCGIVGIEDTNFAKGIEKLLN